MLRLALTMAAVTALATGCQRPTADRTNEQEEPRAGMDDSVMGQEQATQDQQEQAAEQGQTVTIQGQIAQVESDQLEIETSAGETVELKLGANVLTPDGQPLQTQQLQEGAEVRASYSEQDGEKVVNTIEMLGQGTTPSQPQDQPMQQQDQPQP